MQKEDLSELARVYSQVYQKFNVGERWAPKTAKKLLVYWFEKQPDLAFVAESDRKLVGAFVAGIKPWWNGNHISDGELFVHPDYQKQGIATKLSVMLYETAVNKYKVVDFDAYTFNKTKFPLSWYLSKGFVKNEEWVMISGDVKNILKNFKK